jgi:hypothetical protein
LHAFLDRLFPHGFVGLDVLADIAPDRWEHSPLLACFHPSAEQRYKEAVQFHRNIEALTEARRRRQDSEHAIDPPAPEPTLEDVRREHHATPVDPAKGVVELVGLCLWDVFSDNHDVAADGRAIDIGSFRGAGAFLDQHLTRDQNSWREGDYLRFYMGTIWISRRADLTPVYELIVRRLRSAGAEWVYHFQQLYLTELAPSQDDDGPAATYSVSGSAVAELNAQKRRIEMARIRAQIEEMNMRARHEAMDRRPPATVRAYRHVYGPDPRGWPPA